MKISHMTGCDSTVHRRWFDLLQMLETRCCVHSQEPAARMLVSTASLLADTQLPGNGDGDADGGEAAARRAELLQRLEPHLSRQAEQQRFK